MSGKAIAPRFNERELSKLQAYIEQREKTANRCISETEAVKEIVLEYLSLPHSYRQVLIKKRAWREHRNRGFRNLGNFIEVPKRAKAGKCVVTT